MRDLSIAGKAYDLSHLESFIFEFVVPEKGRRPQQIYKIDVQFSWHCFTRGIAAGESSSGPLVYRHGRETRLFDERRYRLSRQLPGILRDIGSRKCFHTGRGNFFTVDLVDEHERRVEYAIFFRMSRRERPRDLKLMVESAYPQDSNMPRARSRPPRPIRFSVIAYNTSIGRPIKQPK